jgi:hypothetical protein
MTRKDIKSISLKQKKKIMNFFSLQRIDIGDKHGDFIYNGLDKMNSFSLFVENPKGRFVNFLGFRYRRKPMLVAYLHFVNAQNCDLHINGVKNVGWGKEKKKALEEKFSLEVGLVCLSVKPIFKKKKLDLTKLQKM